MPEEVRRAQQRLQAAAIYARDSLAGPANIVGAALATGQTLDDVAAWPDRIARGDPGADPGSRSRGVRRTQLGNRNPAPGAHVMKNLCEPDWSRAGLGVLRLCWPPGGLSRAAAMKIERVTSASGIEAWLVQDHSIPVVTLRFTFAGGAILDPPGKDGTAALAASLLDEGAGEYDTTAFHRRLDELAAEMSFSAGHDEFDGTIRMLRANIDESADLLRVALTEPHFADEDVERVRAATLAALRKQARNPRSLSGRLWMSEAFERHPYGRNTSGSTTSVAAITRADLAAFASRQFRRNTLVIGAVGDITPAELATLVERIFGGLPQGEGDPVLPEATPADSGALLVKRSAVPQSSVTFGQAGLKRDDPDWYAALVVNEILGGGGFRGRLMKEIREKRGLAYGVSTGLVPYRHAGLILGSVATENARVAEFDRADPQGMAADARRGADRGRAARCQDLSDRIVPAQSRFDAAHRRSARPHAARRARHRLSRPPRRADLRGHARSGPRGCPPALRPGAAQLCRCRRPGRLAADPPDPRETGLTPRRERIEEPAAPP